MHEICHRCHAELPLRRSSSMGLMDEALLFCPHCSAPQICLPEHMRTPGDSAPLTTGAPPPPRWNAEEIDWRRALQAAALVAFVGAILSIVILKVESLAFFSAVWVMGSGAIALTLYLRRKPRGWTDARTGWKIGLATGLLLIAAKGVALAGTGLVARFALHDMDKFDADTARNSKVAQESALAWMKQQNAGHDLEARYVSLMSSQEIKAGFMLFGVAFQGGLILLVAAGSGAFAGALRTRRTVAAQRD